MCRWNAASGGRWWLSAFLGGFPCSPDSCLGWNVCKRCATGWPFVSGALASSLGCVMGTDKENETMAMDQTREPTMEKPASLTGCWPIIPDGMLAVSFDLVRPLNGKRL